MFNLRHILVAATLVATFFSHFALAQSGNPAVYGALPDITEVQISPDGKKPGGAQADSRRKRRCFFQP